MLSTPWGGFTNPDGTFYMGFLVNYGLGPTIHHRVLEAWSGDQGNDGNRNLQLGYSEFTGVGTSDAASRLPTSRPAAHPTLSGSSSVPSNRPSGHPHPTWSLEPPSSTRAAA